MFRLSTITILAAITSLTGCTTLPTEPSGQTFDSAIGTWVTEWQAMKGSNTTRTALIIVDEKTATYQWNDGKINFFESGSTNLWRGYWTEDWAKKCDVKQGELESWGIVTLRFNEDYNRFEGTWDSCGKGKKAPWDGFR